MASSTVVFASSLLLPSSAVADPSSLACSSSPFLASALPVAPLNRPAATAALVSARCSLSNENQSSSKATARREILAGLASAGAALAVFSSASLAATGPGTSGAERTAKKADQLLKAADKLNLEDAPKRFGPGRIEGGDAGKISQQAGSGAAKGIQQGAGDVAKEASKKSGEFEKRTRNIYGQLIAKKGDVEKAAKEVVGQVQKKGSEVTGGGGGGFFSSIKKTVEDVKENVPSLPQ